MSGDISLRKASARSAASPVGTSPAEMDTSSVTSAKIACRECGASKRPSLSIRAASEARSDPVSLARASWTTIVVICGIAAILLAVGSYTGYAITVAAVGIAAAVNLLPNP
jgi:hypothetical protein